MGGGCGTREEIGRFLPLPGLIAALENRNGTPRRASLRRLLDGHGPLAAATADGRLRPWSAQRRADRLESGVGADMEQAENQRPASSSKGGRLLLDGWEPAEAPT
jgi:hypothetical protein